MEIYFGMVLPITIYVSEQALLINKVKYIPSLIGLNRAFFNLKGIKNHRHFDGFSFFLRIHQWAVLFWVYLYASFVCFFGHMYRHPGSAIAAIPYRQEEITLVDNILVPALIAAVLQITGIRCVFHDHFSRREDCVIALLVFHHAFAVPLFCLPLLCVEAHKQNYEKKVVMLRNNRFSPMQAQKSQINIDKLNITPRNNDEGILPII